MANRPGTKHATTSETIKIHDILKQVLVIHEGGLCSYIPGYNDARVAMEVGSHLSKHSVMGVRTKIFGILRNRTELPPEENDTEKRISEAKEIGMRASRNAEEAVRAANDAVRVVNNLVDDKNDLIIRFDKLVSMLSLNQIIDCKHLHSSKKNIDNKNGDKK